MPENPLKKQRLSADYLLGRNIGDAGTCVSGKGFDAECYPCKGESSQNFRIYFRCETATIIDVNNNHDCTLRNL